MTLPSRQGARQHDLCTRNRTRGSLDGWHARRRGSRCRRLCRRVCLPVRHIWQADISAWGVFGDLSHVRAGSIVARGSGLRGHFASGDRDLTSSTLRTFSAPYPSPAKFRELRFCRFPIWSTWSLIFSSGLAMTSCSEPGGTRCGRQHDRRRLRVGRDTHQRSGVASQGRRADRTFVFHVGRVPFSASARFLFAHISRAITSRTPTAAISIITGLNQHAVLTQLKLLSPDFWICSVR